MALDFGEKVKMEFLRQTNIYNPEEQTFEVIIVGAGSTGSFVALTLAKMGIDNIKVIDFDKIEDHNIPNQFYRIKDIGKYKVTALKEIIKDFTGTVIETWNKKITKKTDMDFNMNTLLIYCTDNIESRKLITEKAEGFPIKIIDTRFGGEGYSIHTLDPSDDKALKEYYTGLDEPIKETPCGEKGIIYTILSLAAEVCNIVKRMDKEETYPKTLRRELKTYRFIEGK